jgi:hypothetical protein
MELFPGRPVIGPHSIMIRKVIPISDKIMLKTIGERAMMIRLGVIAPGIWEQAMSDAYIVEVGSQAAGIVVRTAGGYRFFAATHRFNPLEGQLFRNPRQAECAAIRLVNGDVKLAA